MKKKILRGIIIFIVMLSIFMLASIKMDSVENWKSLPFYTRGHNCDIKNGEEITDWTKISSVFGVMSDDNKAGSLATNDGTNAYNWTLRQKNVFCIESGEHNIYTWYAPSGEFECEDKTLNYILYKASEGNYSNTDLVDGEGNGKYITKYQKMFWSYLAATNSNSNDDVERMKNNAAISNIDSLKKDKRYYNYTEASNYANINTNTKPILSLELTNDNNIKIKVKYDTNLDFNIKYTINDDETNIKTIKKSEMTKISEGDYNYEKTIFDKGKIDVKVTSKIEEYRVKYRILNGKDTEDGNGNTCKHQKLLVVTKTNKITSDNNSEEKSITTNTNLSLQKYITKVTSNDGTVKYNDTTERKNKYADNNSKLTSTTSHKHQGVEISNKSGEKLNNTNTTYKSSNPVQIEAGDKVEYTIKIYNNSTVKASNVLVKDNIGNLGTMKSSYSRDTSKNYTYKIYEGEIGANDTITKKVEVEYNKYTDEKIMNKAWISSTTPKNKAEYRTIDADYIQMKQYSVSLEKYVSSVNGGNKFYDAKYDINERREGKAEYLNYNNKNGKYEDNTKSDSTYTKHNEYKYNNVVTVSNGDTVTYTIKVKNDGKSTVKIIKIKDTLPKGVEYESIDGGNYNNGIITINKTITSETSVEVKLTVTVTEPNISNKILENVAEIPEDGLANKNGVSITDTTLNNNKDADYIQLDYTKPTNKTTSFTVKKVWETNGNERPAQVTVKLLKIKDIDEIDLGMESVVLSDENNWTYTWTDLPILDSGWKYVVRELNENGTDLLPGNGEYNDNITVTYNDNSSKKITTITNTITTPPPPDDNPEETSYSVTKVWQDDNNPDRPASVKVGLFKKNGDKLVQVQKDKDGNKISDITLGSGNWSYTWNNLPKYENDKLVEYIAKEFNEKGKKVLYGKNEENGDDFGSGYTVTYIHEADKTTIYNTKPTTEKSDDFIISGIVWNDMALDKTNNNYNGLKDNEESYLSGITVKLYRDGKGIVATTTTNENGEYRFTSEDLDKSLPDNERYIKGPKENDTNRWDGSYYSYYVIFEYDGITYTSTEYKEFGCADDTELKSNAMENENTRTTFNNQFSTINSESAINYATVNEEGYIPQSKHIYNSSMAMQSSTIKIELKNDTTLENNLKHVNLGLRGRDIFDLELTSDVYSTKVTVNGVDGTYNYNSNKVTVRRNDLNNYNYREDSANTYAQSSKYEGDSYEQIVRQSDITNNAYDNTGLEIEVTYKLTVKNASNTKGTATKITNYYDKNYTFEGAYSDSSCSNKLSDATVSTGNNYNSVIITTQGTQLNQSETMDIYVVYTLNKPVDLLKDLDIGKKLPTYNMAEITEYTTSCGKGQTEFTRGLLDKDSAPGSVATEKVRLTPNLIGTQTTIEYYFGGNDLSKLKYEDDTYATPTLYFVKDDNERTITGTVFEDEIIPSDKTTKIKTGNGKLDDGEVGVYGATVQLIELPKENEENKLSSSRYSVQTDKDGKFEISGFLPGNYIIRYSYGNTVDTVLINTLNNESPKINSKSYNGEDFQATNNGLNAHPDNAKYIDPKLSNLENYWYAINETDKISTGFDDSSRRLIVSNNVIESDEIMTVLNNMRDGNSKDDCKVTYTDSTSKEININVSDVIEKTCMWADTQQMLLTVEETIDLNGGYNTSDIEGKYKIIDKDNNIATWTIFPNEKDEHYKEYKIENMNFGIAEVPVTSIDLSKKLNKFIITDSTGQNVIASFNMDEKKGKVGFVTVADEADGRYWAQIEDEKLQGARLEITYDIRIDMNTEINFDVKGGAIPTITEIVDFIDNSLSYNENLGQNKDNWEVTTYNGDGGLFKTLEKMKFTVDGKDTTTPKGTVDPNGEKYTTIIKATDKNQLLLTTDGTVTVPITLEKVLSSTNSTIEEIITSTVQSYEYSNTVEIVGIDYSNTKTGVTDETTGTRLEVMRDRVRTKDRYIILPGVQHDSATSETLVITPPTGDSSISITYYIIAVISLAVLAVGVFGIKKFVIKK